MEDALRNLYPPTKDFFLMVRVNDEDADALREVANARRLAHMQFPVGMERTMWR